MVLTTQPEVPCDYLIDPRIERYLWVVVRKFNILLLQSVNYYLCVILLFASEFRYIIY